MYSYAQLLFIQNERKNIVLCFGLVDRLKKHFENTKASWYPGYGVM